MAQGRCPEAVAYPIFAQQNYPNPREALPLLALRTLRRRALTESTTKANGRIACANCHLAGKDIDVRVPHEAL